VWNAVLAWALIAAGTLAGVLIALRRRVGRWLALALAAWVLIDFVLGTVSMLSHGESLNPFRYWSVVVQTAPLVAVRWGIDLLWATAAILLLTPRSVGETFALRGRAGTKRSE
jgi:hypothetical protein